MKFMIKITLEYDYKSNLGAEIFNEFSIFSENLRYLRTIKIIASSYRSELFYNSAIKMIQQLKERSCERLHPLTLNFPFNII